MRSLLISVFSLAVSLSALAQGPAVAGGAPSAPASAPAAPQPSAFGMLVPFAAMFAVIYFLMIRPQQSKLKEQQQMLGGLKHGDDVVTNSGILGKVTGITDKVVTLEVSDGVRIKMLKSQVTQVVKGGLKDIAG